MFSFHVIVFLSGHDVYRTDGGPKERRKQSCRACSSASVELGLHDHGKGPRLLDQLPSQRSLAPDVRGRIEPGSILEAISYLHLVSLVIKF